MSNTMQEYLKKIWAYVPADVEYFWMAKLKDGKILSQYDENGGHLFKEVLKEQENGNLDSIGWFSAFPFKQPVIQKLQDGQRAILFIRHKKSIGKDGTTHERIYAIGWQATIKGKNVKHISFIYPDGRIIGGEE